MSHKLYNLQLCDKSEILELRGNGRIGGRMAFGEQLWGGAD